MFQCMRWLPHLHRMLHCCFGPFLFMNSWQISVCDYLTPYQLGTVASKLNSYIDFLCWLMCKGFQMFTRVQVLRVEQPRVPGDKPPGLKQRSHATVSIALEQLCIKPGMQSLPRGKKCFVNFSVDWMCNVCSGTTSRSSCSIKRIHLLYHTT